MITISRIYQKDCTVGVLNYDGFRCLTLELPELSNRNNISCIPEGLYIGRKIISPSLGACLDICDVVCRTFIRIHAGNYTRQILGCILVGDSIKDINNDGILDVTNSGNTLAKLMVMLPDEFQIMIKG